MKPTEPTSGTKSLRTKPTTLSSHTDATETFSQTPSLFVTEEAETTYINLTTEMITERVTLKGTNTVEKIPTDLDSTASPNASIYLPDLLPLPEHASEDGYTATSPPVPIGPVPPTAFPATSEAPTVTLKVTSYSASSSFTSLQPATIAAVSSLSASVTTTASSMPLESSGSFATSATLPLGPDLVSTKTSASILMSTSPIASHSQGSVATTQSSLTERASLPGPTLFTGLPLTHTFAVTSRPMSTVTEPLIHSTSLSTLTTATIPLSKFTALPTSPLYSTTASSLMSIQPDLQRLTSTLLPTSVSSPKALLTPFAPLITKRVSTTAGIIGRTSSSIATQSPTTIWSSLNPKMTHLMSTLVPPPITSQRPKATGEVTIFSKSFHLGLSTASLPGVPQVSKSLVTSVVPTEGKQALHNESSPASAIFVSSPKVAHTRALPSSTSTTPIKVSYDTAQTTSKVSVYSLGQHTELKTVSVVKSAGTFTSSEFPGILSPSTSPSTLFTMLPMTRSSTPHTSGLHSESSPIIPTINMTSTVIQTGTHIQMPVVSLGMHATSASSGSPVAASAIPLSTLSTGISTICTTPLPPPKVSTMLSWETRSSSLASSADSRTLSALPSALSIQPAEPTSTVGMLWNITSTPADVTEKYSHSPIVGALISSAKTTVPSKTASVTKHSPISYELYTATSSAPIPATSKTPIYTTNVTLFTPKPSTEGFRTIPIKMDERTTSGWVMPPTPELQNATSVGKTASKEQENATKSASTKESSLFHLTISSISVTSSTRESSTASRKPVSLSEMTDITLSDWSRVPPPKSIRPYYSVTESEKVRITSLQNITVIESSRSTSVPSGTQTSQVETEIVTTDHAEHASFGTMMHMLMSATPPECTVRALVSTHVTFKNAHLVYN